MNRSPLAHLENSGRLFNSKLSNLSPKNGFSTVGFGQQRSRHHNSIKYSNSMNLGSRLKAKASLNSKIKKNSSYVKIGEYKNNKGRISKENGL